MFFSNLFVIKGMRFSTISFNYYEPVANSLRSKTRKPYVKQENKQILKLPLGVGSGDMIIDEPTGSFSPKGFTQTVAGSTPACNQAISSL
jgi:hypothetical protein